jgi:hypothetical protein
MMLAGVVLVLTSMLGAALAGGPNPNGGPEEAFPPQDVAFFEAQVRPILFDRCVKCHGPRKQSSGLRLDSRQAILKGGDSGPALIPAKPGQSLLIQAISHQRDELKMPPNGKLPETAVATLTRWVALGAPWPADKPRTAASPRDQASVHWAFQPVRRPAALPAIRERDRDWVRSPIDALIAARLEAAGIRPSPPAEKRTLIRRATLDLLGIPPTPDEVDAFVADTSPDAFVRLVNRLLASPMYGQRWGRHWLDVARYADTKGYVFTQERRYPYAYTYRDYVIGAFNADLGFDQFILQQLAADQLDRDGDSRPLAAMGFLTVGRRFLLDQNEIIDDRIDVVSRGLLGLTVTCARCHDHKYDPIPTEDYYSLYGVFASSDEPSELPLLAWSGSSMAAGSAEYQRKLSAARKAREDYLAARGDEVRADLVARFSRYLKAAHDLDLQSRSHRLQERALADGLNSRRLRGVIVLWKRRLEATAKAADPVLAPWQAFAALPREGFAVKAAEIQRAMAVSKAPAVHPLVARAVLGSAPSSMGEVVARYVDLFVQLEKRWKEHTAKSQERPAASLSEVEWESLRQSLFGSNGIFAIAPDEARLFLDQRQRGQFDQLNGAIEWLNASEPGAPARAMVLYDAAQPVAPHVFLRGNPDRPGPAVPRRFLRVLAGGEATPFQKGSGRLELARAIADGRNPLTARVLVNRVWQWHFGKGLVGTPSDFGLRSDPPTHPELLDYLASEFMASGWSIKSLHRWIMLSSTYQQQSLLRPDPAERDPENRLVWRFNPQRLDFETMRDSILAVAGVLEPALGGQPVTITTRPFSSRRTVYGFIDRQNLDGLYRSFDFATPDATSPRRFVTTVPQQALFLMNSPFLHEQARRLAGLVRNNLSAESSAHSDNPTESVCRLYQRVLGRPPEPVELDRAADFLRRHTDWGSPGLDGWKPLLTGKIADAAADPPLSPWEQLAQVLLLTNEFMYID